MSPGPISVLPEDLIRPAPPQPAGPVTAQDVLSVHPADLESLARELTTAVSDLEALPSEAALNDAALAVPGSDTAGACSDVATAITGALRSAAGRLEEMATIAQGTKENYQVADGTFAAGVDKMGDLL